MLLLINCMMQNSRCLRMSGKQDAAIPSFMRRQNQELRTRSSPLSQRWYRLRQQSHKLPKRLKIGYSEFWPKYGLDLKFNNSVAVSSLFSNFTDATLILDIGFGRGESILYSSTQRAKTTCVLGCEIHRPGIAQALISLNENNVSNTTTRLVRSDAAMLLEDYLFESNIFDEVHIFFPDPWPNLERDGGRRIVRPDMLNHFHRLLKPTGVLRVSTDVEEYAEYTIKTILGAGSAWNSSPIADSIVETYRPITSYEKKARESNRTVHNFSFNVNK